MHVYQALSYVHKWNNVHMCRAELMISPCRISRGQMASLTSVKFQIYMTVSNMISYTTGSGLVYVHVHMYVHVHYMCTYTGYMYMYAATLNQSSAPLSVTWGGLWLGSDQLHMHLHVYRYSLVYVEYCHVYMYIYVHAGLWDWIQRIYLLCLRRPCT